MKQFILFFGMVGGIAAILFPPYMIPVTNDRRWGPIWGDVPNTFGAMHISDHIDWLMLGLEVGLIIAAVIAASVALSRR